jgi:hypothetical protein
MGGTIQNNDGYVLCVSSDFKPVGRTIAIRGNLIAQQNGAIDGMLGLMKVG